MWHPKQSIYSGFIKRALDIVLSFFALLILSPVFVVIALLIRVKLGSPVLFKQIRPGFNENLFTMYKFRTMTDERDEFGELLSDSIRLTKFGRTLRSTSLDELPELINIMKGDMSLVGPRPLALEYLPYYTDEERRRHSVRPGLTGLAQINGRNATTWELRFHYDIQYVDEVSFLTDIKIMWMTVKKTIQRSDIGERGVNSPPDFHVYRQNSLEGWR